MPKHILRAVWAATILATCALTAPETCGAGGLALALNAPAKVYLVDEPLFVTVTVRNDGAGDTPFLRMLDPAFGTLAFEILRPGDEAARTYQPLGQADLAPGALAESVAWLPRGGEYSAAADLTYEMRGARPVPLLSRSGQYRLRARYSIPSGWPTGPVTLSSSDLVIIVAEPEGIDAEAHADLYKCNLPYDLRPWNAATEQATCYETVLREYADSGYAVYAQFFLGDILHFDGIHRMRGTPAGLSSLERAAALYVAAAAHAGDTPFGVYALRVAGRCFACSGDVPRATELLGQSFLSPAATAEDRLRALGWIGLAQGGIFQRDAGYGRRDSGSPATQSQLPLRRFATAIGFDVRWNSAKKTVTASTARAKVVLRPGTDAITVNGTPRTGLRASLLRDETLVSPAVIATLMAEHYGTGVAKALASLIPPTPSVAKHERTSRRSQ